MKKTTQFKLGASGTLNVQTFGDGSALVWKEGQRVDEWIAMDKAVVQSLQEILADWPHPLVCPHCGSDQVWKREAPSRWYSVNEPDEWMEFDLDDEFQCSNCLAMARGEEPITNGKGE